MGSNLLLIHFEHLQDKLLMKPIPFIRFNSPAYPSSRLREIEKIE